MLSLPTPTTAPLRCRCCYCCCCCCCVPKLSMCPSITAFPYRYIGVFYDGDMKKKTTEKNRVGFSVSFFLGNRKTDFKKSVFGCEKPKKTTEKTDVRFSVHNPANDTIEYSSCFTSYNSCGLRVLCSSAEGFGSGLALDRLVGAVK